MAQSRPGLKRMTQYPVCMEEYSGDDTHIECSFTSMEQCKNGSSAITGRCFENLYYKPPPPEPAPVAETPPDPAAKSKKQRRSSDLIRNSACEFGLERAGVEAPRRRVRVGIIFVKSP